ASTHPEYDIYCQLFITAPTLPAKVIDGAISHLIDNPDIDSVFTATTETGLFWYQGEPVNQERIPSGLPRTQDAQLIKETTGLYLIRKEPLLVHGSRIGKRAFPYLIDPIYSIDLDTPKDWELAEAAIVKEKIL